MFGDVTVQVTHTLQTLFHRLADVVVYHSRDALDAAAASETTDVRLGCWTCQVREAALYMDSIYRGSRSWSQVPVVESLSDSVDECFNVQIPRMVSLGIFLLIESVPGSVYLPTCEQLLTDAACRRTAGCSCPAICRPRHD